MNLEVLKAEVDHFASLCLPDLTYTDPDTAHFVEIDLGKHYNDALLGPSAGIRIQHAGEDQPHDYLFNKWSRSQLLTMLGTRERWFQSVPIAIQVEELERRRHTMTSAVFRTMRGVDEDEMPYRVVRGLVSTSFADIPDTDIMNALIAAMPDGQYSARLSGKTDRAFYVYAAVPGQELHIPGGTYRGSPAVVVKNSEVGYTSLWVMPALYFGGRAIVLEKHTLLRRIHRGNAGDLTAKFTEALKAASALWASLPTKLSRLDQIKYASAQDAIDAMRSALEACGSSAGFAHNCELAYQRSAGLRRHTAVDVFEVVVEETVAEGISKDTVFERSAIAGALLLRLMA